VRGWKFPSTASASRADLEHEARLLLDPHSRNEPRPEAGRQRSERRFIPIQAEFLSILCDATI
jgi:hypothetical protein